MVDPARATRVTLRPLANALPLGFLALAVATLLVSGLQLQWLDPSQGRVVAFALLAFVFPAQLVASVFGFLARDVVAGTGMGILAGTWLTVALTTLTSPPGSTSRALALFLAIAAIAMLVPASGAASGRLVPAAVLATTAVRFAVTAGYEWTAAADGGSLPASSASSSAPLRSTRRSRCCSRMSSTGRCFRCCAGTAVRRLSRAE